MTLVISSSYLALRYTGTISNLPYPTLHSSLNQSALIPKKEHYIRQDLLVTTPSGTLLMQKGLLEMTRLEAITNCMRTLIFAGYVRTVVFHCVTSRKSRWTRIDRLRTYIHDTRYKIKEDLNRTLRRWKMGLGSSTQYIGTRVQTAHLPHSAPIICLGISKLQFLCLNGTKEMPAPTNALKGSKARSWSPINADIHKEK